MIRAGSLLCCTLLLGCVSPPAAPAPDLAHAAPTPPPLPARAEVELSGAVEAPAADGELHVLVAEGPCWQPQMRVLSDVKPSAEGRFMSEVFVPQGTLLWVCAARMPAKGAVVWYGAAAGAPFKGQGAGEVTFTDLRVVLAKGAPVARPAGAPPAAKAEAGKAEGGKAEAAPSKVAPTH